MNTIKQSANGERYFGHNYLVKLGTKSCKEKKPSNDLHDSSNVQTTCGGKAKNCSSPSFKVSRRVRRRLYL